MARRASKRSKEILREVIQIEKRFAYRIVIELEDYLFFSSMEKGRSTETAPLLHNYALAYAMSWTVSPYYYKYQAPEYEKHLQPLNQEGVYIFPAVPREVTHRLMQYNTTSESFMMTRAQSLGYPNWGFIKCIRPGSTFETYALGHHSLSFPKRIRLGKWMSQARLEIEEIVPKRGKGKYSSVMLNVQDLAEIPTYFTSMYNILPTRIVQSAEWDQDVEGYWLDNLFLPEAAFWWR